MTPHQKIIDMMNQQVTLPVTNFTGSVHIFGEKVDIERLVGVKFSAEFSMPSDDVKRLKQLKARP